MDGAEDLTAGLSTAMASELRWFLADLAEEKQEKERALKLTLDRLHLDLMELERAKKRQAEDWQRESERLDAAREAARHDVHEQNRDAVSRLTSELNRNAEELEKERQKLRALETEHKRVVFLLGLKEQDDYNKIMAKETDRMLAESERWASWTKERETCTLSMALTAVASKQKLLKELKSQAEKWMASGASTQGVGGSERTPMVFKTWMIRDEWRKLQNNRSCLNDGLQNFISRKDIELVIAKNQMLEGKINLKFEKQMQRHMAEVLKKQKKIRAAELKKKMKLEEKTRKELEKVHKAELKKKQRKEAKEKKEAEKLEKKRAKEERAKTSRSRFCCWRSSRAEEDA